MEYNDIATELLESCNIKQSFLAKDYYRGVAVQLTGLCMLQVGNNMMLAVADGSAKPYQTLRWATVEGKTVKNYKLIARHLCDKWQAGTAVNRAEPLSLEGPAGDVSTVCWPALLIWLCPDAEVVLLFQGGFRA